MARSKVIKTRPKFNIGDIVYLYHAVYDEKCSSCIRGEKIDSSYGSKTPTDTFVIRGVHMNRRGDYWYDTIEFHGTFFGYVGYKVEEFQIDKIGEVM